MKKIVLFLMFLCQIGLSIAHPGELIDNQFDRKSEVLKPLMNALSANQLAIYQVDQVFVYQSWIERCMTVLEIQTMVNEAAKADAPLSNAYLNPWAENCSIEVDHLPLLRALANATSTKNVSKPVFNRKPNLYNYRALLLKDKQSPFANRDKCFLIRNIAIESGRSLDPPSRV